MASNVSGPRKKERTRLPSRIGDSSILRRRTANPGSRSPSGSAAASFPTALTRSSGGNLRHALGRRVGRHSLSLFRSLMRKQPISVAKAEPGPPRSRSASILDGPDWLAVPEAHGSGYAAVGREIEDVSTGASPHHLAKRSASVKNDVQALARRDRARTSTLERSGGSHRPVTCRCPEPSAFITQTSIRPVRLLWNAIRFPSGNHEGVSSR